MVRVTAPYRDWAVRDLLEMANSYELVRSLQDGGAQIW